MTRRLAPPAHGAASAGDAAHPGGTHPGDAVHPGIATPGGDPAPAGPILRHRSGLAWRLAAVTAAAVLLAGVIAALLGVGLVRSAARSQAQQALARQADAAVQLIDRAGGSDVRDPATTAVLRAQDVASARITTTGKVTGDRRAADALDPRIKQALLGGQPVSTRVTRDGHMLLVEGRPVAGGGGFVLVQAATDAVGPVERLLDRQLIALAVGVAVACAAGVLLARWLSAPLRRVAQATGHLATGRRDVRVPTGGPREVAQVAESVNALAGALATSEAREREFLLSVTHELRTPLTAVKGFAEAVADGVATGEQARDAGAVILAESARLEHLIGDLLDLARLGAQDFSVNAVPVDLTAAMAQADRVWRARCGEVGVPFATELPAGPLVILTDPVRVRQIVDGLVENALRVTPSGRDIRLTLSAGPGGGAVVEVADSGPGLTAADRAVAFQRSALYERYRGVRPVGTGLGLALVHALAARLGGTATVGESSSGGALFTIGLPGRPAGLA